MLLAAGELCERVSSEPVISKQYSVKQKASERNVSEAFFIMLGAIIISSNLYIIAKLFRSFEDYRQSIKRGYLTYIIGS